VKGIKRIGRRGRISDPFNRDDLGSRDEPGFAASACSSPST